ncbi:unnamed protein product [Camellia sinensis]
MPMVVFSTPATLFPLFFSILLVMPQVTYPNTICLTNTTNYTVRSQFKRSFKVLLFGSPYNNSGDSIFSNAIEADDPDKVYGLFLCKVSVTPKMCQSCVDSALNENLKQCKEAVIWYEPCLIFYSNRPFFSANETSQVVCVLEEQPAREPDKFNEALGSMFDQLSIAPTSNPFRPMNATTNVNFSSRSLNGMVKCTSDLSTMDCRNCLSDAVAAIPSCARGSWVQRVTPSCIGTYELNRVYHDATVAAEAPAPAPAPAEAPSAIRRTDNRSGGWKVKAITITISISTLVVIVLLGSCIHYRRKRAGKGQRFGNNYNCEHLRGEKHTKSHDFPSIELNLIHVATKYFSEENKLGEGGFGPVYKGTLPNGKEIAVKRLSRTSGQGLQELENEVTLIARLQHRNLVKLLGCCLEGNESLLIYEYMPNKSLDIFLFDSTKAVQLDWKRRLLIINGIARGLLYLHEDSRLRIIHRDLKTSNVLLDDEMNPKISDFGMARIFGRNQSESNTNRVVGTYGYMAPEYAMEGIFSIKSDVFSFGVLLLEMISGKRNNGFYLSEHGHSLLTFAWKLWSEDQGLVLMDPLLGQSCVATEVSKCIHIGLLCVQEDASDRPTMSSVVVMLRNNTVTLPRPTQPAFSIGQLVLKSAQSSPIVELYTVNEVTHSDVLPR